MIQNYYKRREVELQQPAICTECNAQEVPPPRQSRPIRNDWIDTAAAAARRPHRRLDTTLKPKVLIQQNGNGYVSSRVSTRQLT